MILLSSFLLIWNSLRAKVVFHLKLGAGLLFIGTLLWGAVHAALLYGDIDVSFYNARVERAIGSRFSGYEVAVGDAVLTRYNGRVCFSFRQVTLKGSNDDSPQIVVPEIKVSLSPIALFLPQREVISVGLEGVSLALIYDQYGRVRIDLDPSLSLDQSAEGTRVVSAAAADPSSAPSSGDETHAGIRSNDELAVVSDERGAPITRSSQITFLVTILREMLSEQFGFFGILGNISELYVDDMSLVFIHERSAMSTKIEKADFVVMVREDGLHVDAEMDWVQAGGIKIPFHWNTVLKEHDGQISISGTIKNTISHQRGSLQRNSDFPLLLDVPLAASFSVDFLKDSKLRRATLNVDVGEGEWHLFDGKNERRLSVGRGVVRMNYDSITRVVEINQSFVRLGSRDISLFGKFFSQPHHTPGSDIWSYGFTLRGGERTDSDLSSKGDVLPWEMDLEGKIDFVHGICKLDYGKFLSGKVDLEFGAGIAVQDGVTNINLKGRASPLSVKDVLAVLPSYLFSHVVQQVDSWVQSGLLEDIEVDLNFYPTDLWQGGVKHLFQSDSLKFSFNFKDLLLDYGKNTPSFEEMSGRAELIGARLKVDLDHGKIQVITSDPLTFTKGSFEIPDIRFNIPQGNLSFLITGSVQSFLSLSHYEALSALGLGKVDMTQIGGDEVRALVDLNIPLQTDITMEHVGVKIRSQLQNVSVGKFWGEEKFSQGQFLLSVRDNVLLLSGSGRLKNMALDVEWSVPLFSSSGNQFGPRITLDLEPLLKGNSFMTFSGPVRVVIIPHLELSAGESSAFSFLADMTQTSLDVPSLVYQKKAGKRARILGELIFQERNRAVKFKTIEVEADHLVLQGSVSLDPSWSLLSANFPTFLLSHGDDAHLAIERQQRVLNVSLEGRYFDIRKFITAVSGNIPLPKDVDEIHLSAKLGSAMGYYGVLLRNMNLRAQMNDISIRSGTVSGQFGDAPLQVELRLDEEKNQQFLVSTQDAGSTLRFIGAYPHLEGGTMSLKGSIPALPNSLIQGQLEIDNFLLKGESILGSTPPVKQKTSESSKIQFRELKTSFKARDWVVSLEELIVRGDTVGFTIHGNVDFQKNRLDLVGTYIPAYTINNLLGHIPLIGGVLVGENGGGILGLTFAVRGSYQSPEIITNPMSLITPGLFRRLFDFSPLGKAVSSSPEENAPNTPQPRTVGGAINSTE